MPVLLCGTLLTGCVSQKNKPEEEITKLADLSGKKAASLTGSIFALQLDTLVTNVEHMYLNDLTAQLEAVESGRAAAVLLDEPVARLAVTQRSGFTILDEKLMVDSYGFAFRKGDPLADQVSAAIERLRADGTLTAMEEKWFSIDEAVRTLPELSYKTDFDGSAGVLQYGCDTSVVPMSYVGSGGKPYGFDVELAMRIAYELNMQFEPIISEMASLILSLETGKCNMVGGCMSITEERKKSVDFSVPYYRGGMVAVIKKSKGTAPVEAITSLEQLAGKKIGILTGSIYGSYMETAIPGGEAVYFNNLSDQVEALNAGKISAVLYDEPGLVDTVKSTTLAMRIAKSLGMGLEISDMDFAALIPSVSTGKSDLAFGQITITEERRQSVLFSVPGSYSKICVLVKSDPGTELPVPLESAETAKPSWHQSFADSFEKTFVTENRYQLILQGLGVTLLISICSAILGTLLGFAVCLMRRARSRWLYLPAKLFVGVIQGTPIVVMLMILFYVIFGNVDLPPVLVAVIGFSINFGAYVSEMMRTGIDAVDKGQLEAASAIGFNKIQVFCKITMPQALRHMLPVFKGEFISMIKMTSVVGYIAIQDLTKMSDIIRSRTYEAFFPLIATALIYLAISYLVVFFISRVEFRVDPKHRKRIVKGVTISDFR